MVDEKLIALNGPEKVNGQKGKLAMICELRADDPPVHVLSSHNRPTHSNYNLPFYLRPRLNLDVSHNQVMNISKPQ